jgi:diadenosine tetraphosphate (Ap4A) HIT family hydrolase
MADMACELCKQPPGELLYQDDQLSIVLVAEPDYPAFCRVIWRQHVKEMTDLKPEEQAYLFRWVLRTEAALRAVLQPDKINLASFGNVVPHLHWHVIPRFADDAHFPAPVWGLRKDSGGVQHTVPGLAEALRLVLTKSIG